MQLNTLANRKPQQFLSHAENIIIVGLYHDVKNNKILMDKAPQGMIQLPGLKIKLNKNPLMTAQERSDRKHMIIDLFFKKTNYIFSAHSTFIFHFENSNRITAVYLINRKLELPISNINNQLILLTADIDQIKQNEKILPNDKEIILDYLQNPEYWQQVKDRTIFPVKLRP